MTKYEIYNGLLAITKARQEACKTEAAGDPQTIFKARIKKEVLDGVLEMWRSYRVENGLFIYAFDKED